MFLVQRYNTAILMATYLCQLAVIFDLSLHIQLIYNVLYIQLHLHMHGTVHLNIAQKFTVSIKFS